MEYSIKFVSKMCDLERKKFLNPMGGIQYFSNWILLRNETHLLFE